MSGNGKYQFLEMTSRLDRALYKITGLQVALLLRIDAKEERQKGDAASAIALADRRLVEPIVRDYAGAYTLTRLGVDAVARVRERMASGMGLGKERPQTKIERRISEALGVGAT